MCKMSYDFQLEREISWQRGSKRGKGRISIGGIRRVDPHGMWSCEWLLDPIAGPEPAISHGEDALHALTLAIQSIDKMIRDALKDGLEVWWLEKGDGCALLSDSYFD